jgi:DNA-binding XRE family transcriptional regulator
MAKHIHRNPNFTPADRQRHKEVRERFQRERPSLEALVASGEYTAAVPHGTYLDILRLIASLREVREAAGLSLTDMAQRSGIDKAALSRLETGQQDNPTLETIYRYVNALGKRLVWRFEEGTDPVGGETVRAG